MSDATPDPDLLCLPTSGWVAGPSFLRPETRTERALSLLLLAALGSGQVRADTACDHLEVTARTLRRVIGDLRAVGLRVAVVGRGEQRTICVGATRDEMDRRLAAEAEANRRLRARMHFTRRGAR